MENGPRQPARSALDGRVLAGRYRIERVVSEELLGRVYLAQDQGSGGRVLVKVLHPHLGQDDPRFGRFVREVRATSMVRHPNTIALLDSGSEDGLHFLVMEHTPGRSLEDELAKGVMPAHRVAHIAAQIAGAIGAAHQESVQHRALSPRNVLLVDGIRHGDLVKVRDFGLSKLERFEGENAEDDEASHLTEAGVRVGNTAYMAPEYIERGRFHPKGDLYALGCLMFAMLTGRPPYTGRAADVLGSHVTASVPRPSQHNPDVPPWMDQVVMSLLAKSPEERPGGYQVVQRLEDGVGHRLEAPDPNGPPPRDTTPAPAPPRVPYGVLAGVAITMTVVAVLASTLVVGGVILMLNWSSSAPELSPVAIAEPPAIAVEVDEPAPEPDPAPAAAPASAPAPRTPAPSRPAAAAAEPAPARSGRTTIKVTANRRALVYLNGTPKGYAPIDLPVPPGQHRVAAMLPGQTDTRQEERIQVRQGEAPTVTFAF